MMLDPVVQAGQQEPEALKRLLAKYGIEIGNNVVIEMNPLKQMATGAADLVIVDTFERNHPRPEDRDALSGDPDRRGRGQAAHGRHRPASRHDQPRQLRRDRPGGPAARGPSGHE